MAAAQLGRRHGALGTGFLRDSSERRG